MIAGETLNSRGITITIMFLPRVFRVAFVIVVLVYCCQGFAAARIPHIEAGGGKTAWGLIEALTASSGIRSFNGTWITDEEFYYRGADKAIYIYNARTQENRLFVDKDFLETYSGGSFTLSPDNRKILIRYGVVAVFRHSYRANYDIFDIETKQVAKVNNGERLQFCQWSTVNDRLSFVYNNNVYIRFETGREYQVTADGIPGEIYNGVPDWVYEEEVLQSDSAMWWSPDGTKLAIGFFNDTRVQNFTYIIYGDSEDPEYQYPHEVTLKYPKPGTTNPVAFVKVFEFTTTGVNSNVIIEAPNDIVSDEHILQWVHWNNKDTMLITWLNRRQNKGTIQSCSYTGACREVKRIEEPEGWISIGSPICLSNGANCLVRNWIGNWFQIWNLDLAKGENVWTAFADSTITGLYGYDEVNQNVYYQATRPGEPIQIHVYRDKTCLTCDLVDVDGQKCKQALARFSKGFSYYSVTCSGPNPSFTDIYETKTNSRLTTWESNSNFRETLTRKLRPRIEFLNVTLGGGFTGNVRLALPPGLDWDNPHQNKKYPLLVYVYGGPNSVRVSNVFTIGFEGFVTTNRTYIYAIIDGRGTGNKGKDCLFTVNNNLGEHEVEDIISVTKYLQDTYSFIDASKTGVWGWSYGGYMAAKTLSNDTNLVFKCGTSVAPVTSWIYYDTIYTERYMGEPTEEDNLAEYQYSSILENVDNFKTHDFLLIHGSGDDNVHYQQSLMLAKVLQEKDILFNQMTYTDEAHSISNYLPHLYNTIDDFFLNCFGIDAANEV